MPKAEQTAPPPLALRRIRGRLRAGRASGAAAVLSEGWLFEPLARPHRALWLWGAGHVGRAIVAVASPLPDFAISWVDTDAARFPAAIPDGVARLIAPVPGELVGQAPADAEHLILTYSHAIDLDLCHRLLQHGFGAAGLIGSATKWARFRSRLRALGHAEAQIARIACPIGDPALGKHPQAIAVGVVAQMLGPAGHRAAAAAGGVS